MSKIDFLAQANPGVARLRPYEPGKPIETLERELGLSDIIKLASNENPLGPCDAVNALLCGEHELARYPDGSGHRLKALLADALGVLPGQITLGNGSNDVLELLARVFLGPGRSAVCSQHAFAVYPLVSMATSAELRVVPALEKSADQAFGHNLAAFAEHIDESTRVVFIANPNNPTGTWVDPAAIEALLEAVPPQVVVVLDEAYCEYQDESQRPDSLALLGRYPNLVITRTFSKVYGLAGLRIGFGLSSPELADLLNRVRQPFNNNSLALAAAELAWQDSAHVAASVALNSEGMAQLQAGIEVLGLRCLPSQANFLCVDFARPAQPLYDALLARGVIVRPLAAYGMPEHLRITVGTPEENARCLQAIKAIL